MAVMPLPGNVSRAVGRAVIHHHNFIRNPGLHGKCIQKPDERLSCVVDRDDHRGCQAGLVGEIQTDVSLSLCVCVFLTPDFLYPSATVKQTGPGRRPGPRGEGTGPSPEEKPSQRKSFSLPMDDQFTSDLSIARIYCLAGVMEEKDALRVDFIPPPDFFLVWQTRQPTRIARTSDVRQDER